MGTLEEFEKLFNPFMYNSLRFGPRAISRRLTAGNAKALFFDMSVERLKYIHVDFPPIFVDKVAVRCLEDKFWVPLRFLALSNLLDSYSLGDRIISAAIENDELELIHICLIRSAELSEHSILRVLMYLLRVRDKPVMQEYVKKGFSDEDPKAAATSLVMTAFMGQVNESFMKESLLQLPMDDILLLLDYASNYLTYYKTNPIEKSNYSPTLTRILDWIIWIVDAQFTNLLLLEEAQQLLITIQQTLKEHMGICATAEPLCGWLCHLLANCKLPQPEVSGHYTIQVLHY